MGWSRTTSYIISECVVMQVFQQPGQDGRHQWCYTAGPGWWSSRLGYSAGEDCGSRPGPDCNEGSFREDGELHSSSGPTGDGFHTLTWEMTETQSNVHYDGELWYEMDDSPPKYSSGPVGSGWSCRDIELRSIRIAPL